jgi:UDP-glucose:(heptosyl)LPS alpha-1,3-glucosyltransferase
MNIVYVVRRYGPVGGMERYVWETVLALRERGHRLTVLCERCHEMAPSGVAVVELGECFPRPRWLALLRFGSRVRAWLEDHPDANRIVHSHERLDSHHLTTWHGPPFASIFERPWWRWLSLRVVMQLYLERRELQVPQRVVPVSTFISSQITRYYPVIASKLSRPVLPAVQPGPRRSPRPIPSDGGVVGFVGKEWDRKGLPLAVEAIALLRRKRPGLELRVVGPEPAAVQHLFSGWSAGYRLVPWAGQVDYPGMDVLLHPARAEPFGMVITEAMAAGLPVVVSDVCGAAQEVGPDAGQVLSRSQPAQVWADAVEAQLSRTTVVPRYERGWDHVATEYESIYSELMALRSSEAVSSG